MAGADQRLLDYLGRGVDCRTPPETWMDELDKGKKIREVNNDNIDVTRCVKNKSKSVYNCEGRKMNVHASMHVKPHEVLKLGGHLKAERCTTNTQKVQTNQTIIKIVKMLDDTSNDPHNITRTDSHYTRYECQLIEFILKYIERQKHRANTKSSDTTGIDKIEDLNREDAVAKLHDLITKTKSEPCQRLWQMVADACCHFLHERKHTHYVLNIELGASSHKVEETHESGTDVAGELQANAMEFTDAAAGGGFQKESKTANTIEETRGRINSDGQVTVEEVIEADLRPVSQLITTPELKILMKKLLECYDQGQEFGPFRISCRITSGRECKIYWQVFGNKEIHGTTEVAEASNFYMKYAGKGFHIFYLTEESETELFVTVQQRDSPLKLSPSTHDKQRFKLKGNTQKKIDVPFRKVDWITKSPFFIKQPKSLTSIKQARYVTITECGANSKEKVNEENDSKSTSSKPTYTTATNKTLKDSGCHNFMLFYFEPTVHEIRIALTRVARPKGCASGPPPPPMPSRVESDSGALTTGSSHTESTPDKEYPNGQDNIDRAFIELVGNQYVFPLQVDTEDIF